MRFTAVYVHGDSGYIVAFVEEFPNIVTQGKTMEQARERVREAIALTIEAHREMLHERLAAAGKTVILREELTV